MMLFKHILRLIGVLAFMLILIAVTPQEGVTGSNNAPRQDKGTPAPPSAQGIAHRIVQPISLHLEGSAQAVEPAAAIMTEGFEGAWPAAGWYLSDQSTDDGGEYLLGDRSCHPHTGSWSGWTVGGGNEGRGLDCSAAYPDNAGTWAEYGPFNLSQASSATLIFYLWGEAEPNGQDCYDAMIAASSIDGSYYDEGYAYCGNWTDGSEGNGFSRVTLDLSSRLGQSQVWITFAFFSDASVAYNGMTVDDIALDVVGQSPVSVTPAAYLPVVYRPGAPAPVCPNDPFEPNGTFEQASGPLTLNQDYLGYFNCAADTDRDYYYFDLPTNRRVVITLDNVPAGSDYDLTLYSCAASGCLVKHSGNPGNAGENIDVTINAGRYYVRITRSAASPLVSQPYRLRVATP